MKMQNIVGICLIAVGVIFVNGITEESKRAASQTVRARNDSPSLETSEGRGKTVRDELAGQGGQMKIYVPAALLEPGSKPLAIILSASRYYGVPAEVLLTHWYLESGMRLGGDGGGAGGYSALRQIISKQSEPAERHRWHRFVANERDLRAIAEHCGYDLQTLQGSSTGALGPMQIQPSTWVLGAVDADGDGQACPLNLADAMFTAAMKLRNDYGRLGDWNGAMLAYGGVNCARNRAYVDRAQPILQQFRNWLASRNLLPN